jgi:hypothetical protein
MKERHLFGSANEVEVVAVVDGEGGWERLRGGGRGECNCGCDQGSENEVGGCSRVVVQESPLSAAE